MEKGRRAATRDASFCR